MYVLHRRLCILHLIFVFMSIFQIVICDTSKKTNKILEKYDTDQYENRV